MCYSSGHFTQGTGGRFLLEYTAEEGEQRGNWSCDFSAGLVLSDVHILLKSSVSPEDEPKGYDVLESEQHYLQFTGFVLVHCL